MLSTGTLEVGTRAVHLVDERDTRNIVAIGLTPDGLGLGLHTRDSTEYRHRAIKDAKAPLHFGGEVYVAGRINDVDTMSVPLTRRGGRGDGNTALPLLLHEVHGSGTVVDFAHAVRAAGVVQDTFSDGGLAGIDMGHDSDVTDFF